MNIEGKKDSLSIEELARFQILNSDYEKFKHLEQKMEILELKIGEFEKEKKKIIVEINKLLETFKNFNSKYPKISENDLIKDINKKLDDLTTRQLSVEEKLNQYDEKLNMIDAKFAELNGSEKTPKNRSVFEEEQQIEPKFLKASDLIQLKNDNKSEKSVIQSKINLCNQLLNYLDQQVDSKSISKKEYEVNKFKIELKIKQLKEN
ncbi:MAG: hypothetical protein ACFFCM_15550, partial [Promethearchaeota archaeon]